MAAAKRKLKTKRWDSAEHLKTDEDIAAYLNACMEEGGDDPAFLAHALGVVAHAQREPACASAWNKPEADAKAP